MSHRMKPLFDAMDGLPDERKATATIAVYAVIPVAVVGILTGAFLTPHPAPDWQLLANGGAGGVGATAVVILTVYLTRWLFGFTGVVRVAEVVLGLIVGGTFGMLLSTSFDLDFWPLLLAPAFAVLNVWFRPFGRRPAAPPDPPAWVPKKWDEPAAPPPEPADWWAVYRTDDAGNSFLVQARLTREEAERLAGEFAARGHKQHYTIERDDAG